MVQFELWTKVEHVGPGRFLARAVATPYGVEQRCAPEERTLECPSPEAAHAAGSKLAEHLRADIVARGNVVVERRPVVAAAPPRRRVAALEAGGAHAHL